MGSCVFQCNVPHQWIAQRQVSPVSVYCDGVGCRVHHMKHHIGQITTATSRHRRDMTSDIRAGVCRPCVETELTATKNSATDGN